jgi:alpha-glucosidase
VKPGKVAWDWWNDWNLYGVDFEAGINTETYKYYIDFASAHGIEYVILDEGWAVNLQADLMQVVPEIDLPALCRYADQKNVGLILWAGYWAFNRDMEGVCRHYSQMGIKGWKIDFMDRDDQPMVQFYEKAAATAAKYRMLCDFHGAYKPAGIQRTYPNVLNFEGIHGLENMKWSTAAVDQVTYDVTVPFTRYVAGPADYTQGAMHNATRRNYFPSNSEPMSQGTRCHQLAEYLIFDAPLTMLCDSPSNYMQEPECTDFIASIPTEWDETVALDGKIAEYVVIARRSGSTWYVGALGNWDARDLEVDLSPLGIQHAEGIAFVDGANAHRAARDYRKVETSVHGPLWKVHLASGGGAVLVLK